MLTVADEVNPSCPALGIFGVLFSGSLDFFTEKPPKVGKILAQNPLKKAEVGKIVAPNPLKRGKRR